MSTDDDTLTTVRSGRTRNSSQHDGSDDEEDDDLDDELPDDIHFHARKTIGGHHINKDEVDSEMGVLEVELVECRDLIAADRGGVSDPYATAELLDAQGVLIGDAVVTPVHRRTLNPYFGLKFAFPRLHHDELCRCTLRVRMRDHDMMDAHDPLGGTDLPVEMYSAAVNSDDWYELEEFEDELDEDEVQNFDATQIEMSGEVGDPPRLPPFLCLQRKRRDLQLSPSPHCLRSRCSQI